MFSMKWESAIWSEVRGVTIQQVTLVCSSGTYAGKGRQSENVYWLERWTKKRRLTSFPFQIWKYLYLASMGWYTLAALTSSRVSTKWDFIQVAENILPFPHLRIIINSSASTLGSKMRQVPSSARSRKCFRSSISKRLSYILMTSLLWAGLLMNTFYWYLKYWGLWQTTVLGWSWTSVTGFSQKVLS